MSPLFSLKNVLLGLATFASVTAQQCFGDVHNYAPILSPRPSEVQNNFVSCDGGHDGPRVFPINATSFDWWYFDAVSEDGTQGLTVIFFTSSFIGFSFNPASIVTPLSVYIFANTGSGPGINFPIVATSVEVVTNGDGATGKWKGTGIQFEGAPDLSTYTLTFDKTLLNLGIEGTFTLNSRGPGHYNCGPLEAGQPEEVLPNIGWVNAMPAADAEVDVKILGKSLKFSGNGYHDKNWGNKAFTSALNSWYWGHASFGGYDLVFFDMIDPQDTNRVGGYVLKDGEVVASTCAGGMSVRPVDAPYPPTLLSPNPAQGKYRIQIDLDDGTSLDALLTSKAVQVEAVLYTRWIGTIEGTVGGVTAVGSAVWEQFKTQVA